jgi:hypothetical protein
MPTGRLSLFHASLSDAEVEDCVSQLKLLAALLPRPTDRLHCLAELLNVRSQQMQAHVASRRGS